MDALGRLLRSFDHHVRRDTVAAKCDPLDFGSQLFVDRAGGDLAISVYEIQRFDDRINEILAMSLYITGPQRP